MIRIFIALSLLGLVASCKTTKESKTTSLVSTTVTQNVCHPENFISYQNGMLAIKKTNFDPVLCYNFMWMLYDQKTNSECFYVTQLEKKEATFILPEELKKIKSNLGITELYKKHMSEEKNAITQKQLKQMIQFEKNLISLAKPVTPHYIKQSGFEGRFNEKKPELNTVFQDIILNKKQTHSPKKRSYKDLLSLGAGAVNKIAGTGLYTACLSSPVGTAVIPCSLRYSVITNEPQKLITSGLKNYAQTNIDTRQHFNKLTEIPGSTFIDIIESTVETYNADEYIASNKCPTSLN